MKKIKFKALEVKMIDINKIIPNGYNPNRVAVPEMKLLKQSIVDNGFCFPIVCIYDNNNDNYTIIDGYHRYLVSKDYLKIKYIPVVVLDHSIDKRMTATVQFNRARGTHQIIDMSKIVLELIKEGYSDADICKYLGMDSDEVLRLKQITGLKEAFKDHNFSKSWEEFENKMKKIEGDEKDEEKIELS